MVLRTFFLVKPRAEWREVKQNVERSTAPEKGLQDSARVSTLGSIQLGVAPEAFDPFDALSLT